MNDNTTCAYVDWDERWRTEAGPTDWKTTVPDEEDRTGMCGPRGGRKARTRPRLRYWTA